MGFDIAALAQDGVGILVTAMTTEAWSRLRIRLGNLFGHGDQGQEQQILDELDEACAAIERATDGEDTREAEAELRGLFKTRLRADPELAARFAALMQELASQFPTTAPAATTITQTARVEHGGTVVQSGRDIVSHTPWPLAEPSGTVKTS